MNIRSASWMPFRLPVVGAFTTAHGPIQVREGAILHLTAHDGLIGLGEAAPLPAFGGSTLDDALTVLGELGPHLPSLDLDAAEELLVGMDLARPGAAAVACALDTALCDLRARAAGLPLAALLGEPRAPVPVNATIGAPDDGDACQAARSAVAAGFTCVKLKVGLGPTRAAEIARIAALRAAIGPDIRLRIDANGSWDVATAIAILNAVESHRLELVEQPVAAADLAGMARVRSAVATLIAADESVAGPEQARAVIAAGAADILVVKPMLAGGPRRAREVIALAHAAGLRALVTTTIDSGVGTTMALHLAATLPAPSLACGLATAPLLAGDLLARPLAIHDGSMPLPSAPGLGVTLDERQLARYGGAWIELSPQS
jgi:o-succinylbenzoate synthase